MRRSVEPAERPVLALVGLRCSGKTSVGRLVAERAGVPFLDLDDLLCALAREHFHEAPSAGALLAQVGLEVFRKLEARALRTALRHAPPFVLATGGGCVERERSRRLLQARSFCVWLDAPPTVLAERLRADAATPRPALLGGDAAGELEELARLRGPWYAEAAHLRLSAGFETPPELAARVLEAWRGGRDTS